MKYFWLFSSSVHHRFCCCGGAIHSWVHGSIVIIKSNSGIALHATLAPPDLVSSSKMSCNISFIHYLHTTHLLTHNRRGKVFQSTDLVSLHYVKLSEDSSVTWAESTSAATKQIEQSKGVAYLHICNLTNEIPWCLDTKR